MARHTKKHYIKIRERYIKCCLDILNEGKAKSQTELGMSLGVHPAQLNKLIRVVKDKLLDSEAPTLDMIVDIAMIYGYSSEWIMTGTGSMKLKETEKSKLTRLESQIKQIHEILNL